jgi:hypothetical protein
MIIVAVKVLVIEPILSLVAGFNFFPLDSSANPYAFEKTILSFSNIESEPMNLLLVYK